MKALLTSMGRHKAHSVHWQQTRRRIGGKKTPEILLFGARKLLNWSDKWDTVRFIHQRLLFGLWSDTCRLFLSSDKPQKKCLLDHFLKALEEGRVSTEQKRLAAQQLEKENQNDTSGLIPRTLNRNYQRNYLITLPCSHSNWLGVTNKADLYIYIDTCTFVV